MAEPRVLILRAPGTNCDVETAYAFEVAGAQVQRLHVNRILSQPGLLKEFQVLCLPGGFSYGDDVAAGRILGNQIRHHLRDRLCEFRDDGKLILGICNGFQVLMNSEVLLDVAASGTDTHSTPATLTWNDSGKFEDRWVNLQVAGDKSVFLQGIESMYLPIAHAEGKFVARDEGQLSSLDEAGCLVLRYVRGPASGSNGTVPYPLNPNGSQRNVAGLSDSTGRVLGMMPHPERHIDPTQHPRWTRGDANDVGDGLAVFANAVEYFR